MPHESHYALSCLSLVEGIDHASCVGNIFYVVQQRSTQLQRNLRKILVIEITKTIVGKILDVVDYSAILFARNHLHTLHDNLVVLRIS